MGDPAIKLFGKTIPLMETGSGLGSDRDQDPIAELAGEDKDVAGETTNNEVNHTDPDAPIDMEQEEENSPSSVNNPNENEQQISSQDVIEKSDSKPEQDQSETDASGEEKVLKKPDKILPCPRCNSLDTKFCYYNNYNVNQPRHFCKNCQRYWTAGGTMRNVPVGAGRRKHKNSASPHYRHIMMSHEPLATSTREAAAATDSTTHHHVVAMRSVNGNNGTVLKFGPEAPLCESMSSVLNLGEQKKKREFSTEEPSCASSVTASNCAENGFPEQNGIQGYSNGPTPMHAMHYFPGPPWAYPWGPGWNNVAAASATAIVNGSEVGAMSSIQWSPPPILAAPAFCAPPIPVPFMPASFWPAGAWNVPWAGPSGCLSPSSSTSNSGCSGNGGSPTLGKHSRDVTSLQGEEKTGKSLWVPKTLRIDEAAKSSIWATLGIKPDDGGMFKAFQFKGQSKGQRTDSPQLYANPAALSRSQSFQESA